MNPFIRWCRFNLVGIMGMAVQLATLALLNRLMHGHYLLATAAAIELALLHNFIWHLHYTWRDRTGGSTFSQLTRFHLSNGVISMVGNIVIMRFLVREARMPVLIANGMAILCCSMLNFIACNVWAFAAKTPASVRGGKPESAASIPVMARMQPKGQVETG